MVNRHVIRLRGPWWGRLTRSGRNPPIDADDGHSDFKTSCPFANQGQVLADFVGTVRLIRKFNGSPGMTQATQVWLTIASVAVPTEVIFNGTSVAIAAPQRAPLEIPIARLLGPFNQVDLVLQFTENSGLTSPPSGDLVGEVAIEIAQ